MARITIKSLQHEIYLKQERIEWLERRMQTKELEVNFLNKQVKQTGSAGLLAEACSRSVDASAHALTAITDIMKRRLN